KNTRNEQKINHFIFFVQAEDGIRDRNVTGVQTCALPIFKLQKANEKNDSLMKSMKKNEEGKNKLIEESIQKNADLQRKNVELLCRNKENIEQQIEEIEKRKKKT